LRGEKGRSETAGELSRAGEDSPVTRKSYGSGEARNPVIMDPMLGRIKIREKVNQETKNWWESAGGGSK